MRKWKKMLIGMMVAVMSFQIATNSTVYTAPVYAKQTEENATKKYTIDNVAAKSFKTDISMGNISLSYSKDDTVTIKVKYKATGNQKDKLSEILKVVNLKCLIEKDTVKISIINKNTKKDIWEWIQDTYKNSNLNLNVDLDIALPSSVNGFYINDALGNIDLNSMKGKFNINNSLGNISLDNITFVGKSEINVALGNIKCSLSKDILKSSEVTMDNAMGNITVDVNNMSYTKESKDNGENDWDFGDAEKIVVKKLCQIDANVDMGELTIGE